MPRKVRHTSERFGSMQYRINITDDSGVYANNMQRIADTIEACYSKGRWTLVHVRYLLGDGVTNSMVLAAIRKQFGVTNFRYVWALEKSGQKGDNGNAHYHLACFIESRNKSMNAVGMLLHKLTQDGVLSNYKRMAPDHKKASADLMAEINEDDLKSASSGFGLTIENMSAVRFAVYWMSYLAKEKTKVTDARSFGSSLMPNDWRETATRLPTLAGSKVVPSDPYFE